MSEHRTRGNRGGGRGQSHRGGQRGRRKVCGFCVDRIEHIDYKDAKRLQRYVSERGKILPRRRTGTCAKHQRALAVAIKRARHMALLPFVRLHTAR
ncbi:MAG: 30S ribosomal protein S18 [Chloroflexia bacterium]|nr:30S ribosomal protein S18 [Chloroflexia bacterium]